MANPLFVRFPGIDGNYISTNDTNLLNCDSSWFSQGTGGLWTVGTPSTEQQKGTSLRSLKVTGGVYTAITPVTDGPDFSLYIYSPTGDEFDINGGAPVAVPPDTWSAVTDGGNAGTYTVNSAGADDYYLAEVMLGDPTFVPSLGIVGDLDIRAKTTISSATAGECYIIGNRDGDRGYHLAQNAGSQNRMFSRYGTGSNQRLASDSVGVVADVSSDLRATFDTSDNGTWQYAIDGSDTGRAVTGNTDPALPSGSSMAVGSTTGGGSGWFVGTIQAAEVHDDIDGPIVAQFLASDIP